MSVRIGTSGWIYPHWKGIFYPPGLPPDEALRYYAQHFGTVEINYSFYRLPSAEAFAAWRAATLPDFCFAVKGSRFVTHMKRLKDPEVHVPKFYARAEILGDKLGPVLWQLPPQFQRDDARLEAFLATLPAQHLNAVEFRHASWLAPAVYDLLRRFRVALCVANSHGQNLPPEPLLTANWTYLRFHSGLGGGGDYTEDQLREWADRITAFRANGVAVFAYFNNDWQGFAPKNATRLKELLGFER